MLSSLFRVVLRPLLLVAAVVVVTALFADRGPVPFPYILGAVLPASLLAICIGWKRRSVFAASEQERANPSVETLFRPGSQRA